MRILIVYDSVSPQKNTEKIAVEIAKNLREKGLEVDCLNVNSVDKTSVKSYDGLLVGSPTMAFSATTPIKQFLDSYSADEFRGKFAAAFDTRVKLIFSGQAAKGIQQKLEKLGFKIVVAPLVAYVVGSNRKNDYVLKEGELDKARVYAEGLANALMSK